MALADNLTAYYACDEASGDLIDQLAANTLPAFAAPGAGTGLLNGCRTFDDSLSQYFGVTGSPVPAALRTLGGSFTVAFWVYKQWASLAGIMNCGSGGNPEWMFFAVGGNRLSLGYFNALGNHEVSISDPTANTWTYVAAGYMASTTTWWISANAGTRVTSIGTGCVLNAGDFRVSTNRDGFTYLKGKLDEIGLWQREVSDAELVTMYNSGVPLGYSGIAGSPANAGPLIGPGRVVGGQINTGRLARC